MTIERDLPKVDIYVCGFPCQPFSLAGKRLGKDDKRNLFDSPNVFILENVKSLIYNEYFEYIKLKLEELDYNISYNIYNTRDYGIPQNRERLYIIGIKKSLNATISKIPKKKMKSIHNYIDKTDTHRDNLSDKFKDSVEKSQGIFIDLGFIKLVSSKCYSTYSPTITKNTSMWCKPMHRKANIKELLKLQGFPSNFKHLNVSDAEFKKQLGNSMSINVLIEIFNNLVQIGII